MHITKEAYLLARGELNGLHFLYRFEYNDDPASPIPEEAVKEQRRLGDICRAYAESQWMEVPYHTKAWCYALLEKAKTSKEYLEAVKGWRIRSKR
jgi:hypothetical protein